MDEAKKTKKNEKKKQKQATEKGGHKKPWLEVELVHLYFRKPVGVESGEFMSVARALQTVSANISQKLSTVYLGRAFGELGFERVKYGGLRGYLVVQRTGDEMKRLQCEMAYKAVVDGGQ